MSQVINSYRLIWSFPICQENLGRSLFQKQTPFTFLSELDSQFITLLSSDSDLPSVGLNFSSEEVNDTININIDGEETLPITLSTDEEIGTIELNLV